MDVKKEKGVKEIEDTKVDEIKKEVEEINSELITTAVETIHANSVAPLLVAEPVSQPSPIIPIPVKIVPSDTATIKQCAEEYLKITCPKVVFVYTGLKVGSTSLVSSFRLFASKKINVFHFHNENMLPQKFKDAGVTINDLIHYCATVLDKKVYVIDVYRTPIEKKISTFFERAAVHHFNAPETVVATYPVNKLIKRFNQVFPYIGTEDYLSECYGDKVRDKVSQEFPNGFPPMQHHLAFDCGMVKYIKLRLMDSMHWGSILSTIFGMHIEVVTDYASDKKALGSLYVAFKREYKIPEAYLNFVKYSDTQFAFYLSQKERAAYIAKWGCCHPDTNADAVPFTDQEYAFYSQMSKENSYMDKVERTEEHYLDEGCVCDACMKRRKEVAEKIIAAPHHPINASHRIHHREAVKKHMIHRVATSVSTNRMATSVSTNRIAENNGGIRMRNGAATSNILSTGIRLRKSGRNRRKSRSRSYSVRMKLF